MASSHAEHEQPDTPTGSALPPGEPAAQSGRPAAAAGEPAAAPGKPGKPGGPAVPTASARGAQRPLAEEAAQLTEGTLHDWQRRNASASMPLALRQLVVAGNLDNVRLAIATAGSRIQAARTPATVGAISVDVATADGAPADGDGRRPRQLGPVDPLPGLGYRGPVFMDSDIYKTLEAIGWELAHGPEPALADFAASTIDLLRQAQQPDGYLNSYVQASGEPRYARLAWSHEMYCAGHLIQAAIAMRRGTGDTSLLDIATRLADHLVREFADKENGLDGHPIIETALTELYRETGTESYLSLAQQFVDQRGHGLAGDSGLGRRYLQDHMPVREVPSEVGHAVRALYLEAGVTDVATETHDDELLQSAIRRWDDMVATKTALTGGNGSRHVDEGFGDRFELPPDRSYNETCAAIASFQWSWRLLLATGDAKYADHMERVLYNGFAGAVSSMGDRFFYVNPLQRREDHFEKDDPGRRRVWFNCACCPPNIMRLLASLEHYLATTAADGSTLYVHQYAGARIAGAGLDLELTTDYPWSGLVTVRVKAAPSTARGLALRIPDWSASTSFKINNFSERSVAQHTGYLLLHQEWRPGDEITLHLDMTPRWTYPDRRVDAVRGCAAIERGPLVYCFEQADQLVRLDELAARPGTRLTEREVTLDGIGRTIQISAPGRHLPPAAESTVPRISAVAIPYFQWDNRGPGGMRVWIPGA
ncbi:MAG: glycoside hydrolase family 127 protein [Streptosporangiaceae bacterium]|nr:glycoside hydrolase family 127 protein [Streptosporangiaceae bacterium]